MGFFLWVALASRIFGQDSGRFRFFILPTGETLGPGEISASLDAFFFPYVGVGFSSKFSLFAGPFLAEKGGGFLAPKFRIFEKKGVSFSAGGFLYFLKEEGGDETEGVGYISLSVKDKGMKFGAAMGYGALFGYRSPIFLGTGLEVAAGSNFWLSGEAGFSSGYGLEYVILGAKVLPTSNLSLRIGIFALEGNFEHPLPLIFATYRVKR